jgi:tetratricopeptide (TPR) repeat protein
MARRTLKFSAATLLPKRKFIGKNFLEFWFKSAAKSKEIANKRFYGVVMDHTESESARRRRMFVALAMSVAAATIACAPTSAAASLSDQLSQKIAQARAAEKSRDFDAALQVYQSAMKMDRGTPEAMRELLKNRSALFESINLYDNAEADLTEAFKVTPDDATAYADRGYFYMRRGRYRDALGDFVTGSRLDPQNPLYLYAAARSLVAAGDLDGAVAFYTESIKAGPREGKLYLARAEAEVRLQRWPEALADYERARSLGLASTTENYFLFAGRGFVALKFADHQTALANFDAALAIDPNAVNVLMWRGYAHERRGELAAALRDYEHAASLQPSNIVMGESVRRVRLAQR